MLAGAYMICMVNAILYQIRTITRKSRRFILFYFGIIGHIHCWKVFYELFGGDDDNLPLLEVSQILGMGRAGIVWERACTGSCSSIYISVLESEKTKKKEQDLISYTICTHVLFCSSTSSLSTAAQRRWAQFCVFTLPCSANWCILLPVLLTKLTKKKNLSGLSWVFRLPG